MINFLIFLFARILSTVFNPIVLLLPVPYIVVFHTTRNMPESVRWTFFTWIFIFSIGVFVLYQVKRGKFTNLDVSKREQRPLLFGFIGLIAAIYIISLLLLHGPKAMIALTCGVLFGLAVLDVINTKIKASIHVAAVTSILLSFVILNGVALAPILLLIPFIAWSRVLLHRHSVTETVTGAIFGVFLTFIVYAMIEFILRY